MMKFIDGKQYIVVEPIVDFAHIEYVIVLRYQPIASGDMGTRFLSVGIAFRN